VLVAFVAVYNGASVQPTVSSVSGGGVSSWTAQPGTNIPEDFDIAPVNQGSLFMFRAATGTTPGSGAVTFNFGQSNVSFAWAIIEVADTDTGGTNGSNAIVQAEGRDDNISPETTATLAAFGSSDNRGIVAYAKNSSTNPMWTASANWSIGSHQQVGSPSLVFAWGYSDSAVTSAAWTQATGSAPAGNIIAEVKFLAGTTTRTVTHTADAVLRATPTVSHTAGAIVQKIGVLTHSADALVQRIGEATHTADAVKIALGRTTTHDADVVLTGGAAVGHTATAVVISLGRVVAHSASAVVGAATGITIYRNTGQYRDAKPYRGFGVTVTTPTVSHTASAVLIRVPLASHTADAIVGAAGALQKSHTASAHLVAAGTGVSHSANAVIKKLGLTKSHTADAVLTQSLVAPVFARLAEDVPQSVFQGNMGNQTAIYLPWNRPVGLTNRIHTNPTCCETIDYVDPVYGAVQDPEGWGTLRIKPARQASVTYGERHVSPADSAYQYSVVTTGAHVAIPFSNTALTESVPDPDGGTIEHTTDFGWYQEYFVRETEVGLPFAFGVDMKLVAGTGRMRVVLEAIDVEGNTLAQASSAFSGSTSFTRLTAALSSIPANARYLRIQVRYRPTSNQTGTVQFRRAQLEKNPSAGSYVGTGTAAGNLLVMCLTVAYNNTQPNPVVPSDWVSVRRSHRPPGANDAEGVSTFIYIIPDATTQRLHGELVTFTEARQAAGSLTEIENAGVLDVSGEARGRSDALTSGQSTKVGGNKRIILGAIGNATGMKQQNSSSTGSGQVRRLGQRSSIHQDGARRVTHALYYKRVDVDGAKDWRSYRVDAALNNPRGFAGAIAVIESDHDAPPPPPEPPPLQVPLKKGVLPSLFVKVYLREGDGPMRILGWDAAFDGLEFGDVSPGGYDSCTFNIAQYERETWANVYRAMAKVRIEVANGAAKGQVVWEGFCKHPTQGPDGKWRISAVGYKTFLEEVEEPMGWQTRSIQVWGTDDDTEFAEANYKGADAIDAVVRKGGMAFRVNKGSDIVTGQKKRFTLFQESHRIRHVAGVVAVERNAGPAWAMFMERGSADVPRGPSDLGNAYNFSAELAQVGRTKFAVDFNVPRGVVCIRLERTGPSTDSMPNMYRVDFENMRVNGDAYRAGYTPPNWDRYTVRQVMLDLCARLDFNSDLVARVTNAGGDLPNILPLWWSEGSWADLVTKLAEAHGFRWHVWGLGGANNKPMLEFRGWQMHNTAWRVKAYGSDAHAIADIDPSEEPYGIVRVTYRLQSVAGVRSKTAIVKDPETGEAMFYGIDLPRRREYKFHLDDEQPNGDLAQSVADFIATDLGDQNFGGTITLADAVDIDDPVTNDGEEKRQPAYLIRSGHIVTVPDYPGGGRSFRVYETRKTEEGVELTVGRTPTRVERMLWYDRMRRARRGHIISPLGF